MGYKTIQMIIYNSRVNYKMRKTPPVFVTAGDKKLIKNHESTLTVWDSEAD